MISAVGAGGSGGGSEAWGAHTQFSPSTRCIVFGMQHRAVQGMLDFDYLCKRAKPSVAAIVFPTSAPSCSAHSLTERPVEACIRAASTARRLCTACSLRPSVCAKTLSVDCGAPLI
jgi:hypothetical protein